MDAKTFAVEMKETVEAIKRKQGIESIKCENLIAYLDEVIKTPSAEISQANLEKYKAELQVWVERNRSQLAGDLEMFRSVITAGQNALRTAFLMTGGASLAMLAFLGHLATGPAPEKVRLFAPSLNVFVWAVLVATVASGATYLSQWFYASWQSWMKKVGFGLNILAILLGIGAYGVFIFGVLKASNAFMCFK